MGEQERPSEIIPPTPATLKKYGLSLEEWWGILERQGYVCPICKKVPSKGRFVIDHQHVPKYKFMPPEQQRMYVRGITCWWCNHAYLGRGITEEKALNAAQYLVAYGKRLALMRG